MSKETRLAVKESRIQYWRKVFEDRINSGLKPREYCDTHGISKDQYYYWLRKVREAALNENSIQLVEIKEATIVSGNTKDKETLGIGIDICVLAMPLLDTRNVMDLIGT